MAKIQKRAPMTLEQERQKKLTLYGAGLFSLALVIIAFAYIALDEEKTQICPSCNQHYVIIDNSEKIQEKEIVLIRAPSKALDVNGKCLGRQRYTQGLMGVIWNRSRIGDQINLYGLSDNSFEAELLLSTVRVKNPDIEKVGLDENAALLYKAQDQAYCSINNQLEGFSEQEDLPQSKIFETLHDIAIKIRNHQEANGGGLSYTLTLYSDLFQNSDSYSFYKNPLEFSEWTASQRSTIGVAKFPPRVFVNVEKLPRAKSPVSEQFLSEFWTDYLEASGARYLIRPN